MSCRVAGFLAVTAVTAVIGACGSKAKLSPVTGAVFYKNEPAAGATVVFHLKDGPPDAPKPSGTVAADGTFKLTTYQLGAGAPPGEYTVAVTWFPPDAREAENPRSKLPEEYGNPSASPLRATVGDGPTEVPPFRIE